MKKIFTFLALCFALVANAQVDTVPAFKKNPHIPQFKLLQTDSTWFSNKDIPKNKPVVIVYFSPECGHCQLTAQEFSKSMDELKDVFLIWVSAYRYSTDQIKQFAEEYQLNRFSNVRLGKETKYFIPVFYDIKFTPFMAVYDKKGKLLKTYPEGTHPDTLAHLIFPSKS